jgi:transposase InsO family protein
MALKVVSMDELKLQVLLEPQRTGESVGEVCLRRGISRASFYRYRRRYLEEGPSGLDCRSRRPRTCPGQIEAFVEVEICTLRRRHPRWGARRIRAELRRAGIEPPATSTIHQVLRRNFLVPPQPPRRRRASKRFEREAPNDLWQIDATQIALAGGEEAWVVDCLDDHARLCLSAQACDSPSGEAAWACFTSAAALYGLPRQLLSDNHLSFTGRLFGVEVAFERKLAEIGVELINAAPAHPQTLGKLERFHRTLKEWLRDEVPASDLAYLQLLLDRFRSHYNEERPHQGISDRTPLECYGAGWAGTGALAAPVPAEETQPHYPPRSIVRKVSSNGVFAYGGSDINIGMRFAGGRVRILQVGELIHVYYGEELVRSLAPDRSRRYQRLDKRPGRRSPGQKD